MSLGSIRREYRGQPLVEEAAAADPFEQFAGWFADARATEPDATAMTLATATPDGRPSARMVLLKDVDARGFVFYTNYESRKAGELEDTRRAALLFYWPTFERQVRVEGIVSRVPEAESDAYFASRPLESRWSAVASPQSRPIAGREDLAAVEEGVSRRGGGHLVKHVFHSEDQGSRPLVGLHSVHVRVIGGELPGVDRVLLRQVGLGCLPVPPLRARPDSIAFSEV